MVGFPVLPECMGAGRDRARGRRSRKRIRGGKVIISGLVGGIGLAGGGGKPPMVHGSA
jgi:hypothetical protein